MALSEDATVGSSASVTLKLGTGAVAIFTRTTDPDGDSDPWQSAAMGSIYIKQSQTDNIPAWWGKVDSDGADDDWVKFWVDKDEDSSGKSLECTLTMDADKKLYFRDTAIYAHSSGDGTLQLTADTSIRLGDGTNDLVIASDGTLSLEGTAKVTAALMLPLIIGGGTATIEAFLGAPTINLDADGEIWYSSFEAPNDWDGASDLTLVWMVHNEAAEDDGDDVSFTCQVRGYADGETMSDAGQTVAAALNLTGGDEAINIINRVTGTIDYDHATYPIAAGDTVVVKQVVNLAGAGEADGPLQVVAQWVEYSKSKLGT